MKHTLTLLALLLAGVINLQAQEPTANEVAWGNLIAGGLTTEAAAVTPEGITIKDAILAGSTITWNEAHIVEAYAHYSGNSETMPALAASNKTGEGMVYAKAFVKTIDRDMTGWTNEMIAKNAWWAGTLAMDPNATPAFRTEVWSVFSASPMHWHPAFFKSYRSGLPKAEQIEVTQRQKDLLIAAIHRDAAANAWLAEMSADLIALQLDQ